MSMIRILKFLHLQSIRYLTVTISNISSSVEINNLYLVSSYYPVSQEGTFCCSDSLLNDIYQAGKIRCNFAARTIIWILLFIRKLRLYGGLYD